MLTRYGKISLLIILFTLSFSTQISAEEVISENSGTEWLYEYSSKISKKIGTVKFNINNGQEDGPSETVVYNLKDNNFNRKETFSYERPLPLGNIIVDAVNNISMRAYHEFSPYLLLDNPPRKLDSSSFKKSTPRFSYLDDPGWVFTGQNLGIEKIKIGDRDVEATKFKFYGQRPTYLAHCRQGQEGEISGEVWYLKGINRYVKQVVSTFHCRIAGPGFQLDEETYTLSPDSPAFKNFGKDSEGGKNAANRMTIDYAKDQCKSLGFVEKTENFGNCVLQLLK